MTRFFDVGLQAGCPHKVIRVERWCCGMSNSTHLSKMEATWRIREPSAPVVVSKRSRVELLTLGLDLWSTKRDWSYGQKCCSLRLPPVRSQRVSKPQRSPSSTTLS